MICCDVCKLDNETVRMGEYALKLIEEDEEDGNNILKRLDLHLCDQCIEKIMPLIKKTIKNSYLKIRDEDIQRATENVLNRDTE
jgi:hypothetical protein